MIPSPGSSTTIQSARGLLNNIPSRVAGWFRGKFATIATKIKCLVPGAGSTHRARQAERTSLAARRVSSDSQEQDHSSVVMTSGSRVSKDDLPVLTGAELQRACVEVLVPLTEKITVLMKDLKTKAGSVIETFDLDAYYVEQFRAGLNVNHSHLLAKRIDVDELFINECNGCIDLLKEITVKQREKFVSSLTWLDRLYDVHIDQAAETCQFGKGLTLNYVNDGSKLAEKDEVRSLQKEVLWFHLTLTDLNKEGKIKDLIVCDAKLRNEFSEIQKVMDTLMQTLKMNP